LPSTLQAGSKEKYMGLLVELFSVLLIL